jgi:LysR family transcriptional regulator, low CO2-responsive transcriptional regulator
MFPFLPAQLRAFMAVLEHGSLRGAADALGVSPAAISSSLASLRRAVGVPLFAREGRGLKLTPAGISFAQDVRRMLALSASSIASAKAAMQEPRPPLRLGAVPAAGEAFLGNLIAKFMVNAADLPVELEVMPRETLLSSVERREVDIGFAEAPPNRKTLRFLAMRQNDYVVAAPRAKRYSKAILAESVWLLREPGSGTRAATEEFLRDYGISPRVRVMGSSATIVRCIREATGVSLLPRYLITDEVHAGKMQIVRTPFTPKPRPWYLITAADRDVSPDMERFLRFALKTRAFRLHD